MPILILYVAKKNLTYYKCDQFILSLVSVTREIILDNRYKNNKYTCNISIYTYASVRYLLSTSYICLVFLV